MSNEELVAKIQAGEDVQTNMGILYQQNWKLICKFVNPFVSERLEFDDLMQEAYLGLHEAVKNYDPSKGCLFMTYAKWQIERQLQRYACNFCFGHEIPIHFVRLMYKYNRAVGDYFSKYHEEPSDDYICEALQIGHKSLENLKKEIIGCYPVSFEDAVPGVDDMTIGDTIADPHDDYEDLIVRLSEQRIKTELWNCVNSLDPGLAEVIRLHYKDGYTLTGIAFVLGCSCSWVRDIQKKAFRLLKKKTAVQEAAEFYGYSSKLLYHDSFSFYRNHGMSAVEFTALKRLQNEESQKKIDRKIEQGKISIDCMLGDILHIISTLQEEYERYMDWAKRLKESSPSTYQNLIQIADNTQREIQDKTAEYERLKNSATTN